MDESGDLAELANTDEAASESESEDEEVFFGPTTMKEKLVVQTAALLEHDNGNGNTTAQQNKDSSVPPEPIKNSDDVINDEKDENDDDDDEIFFGGVSVKECTRRLHNMPAVLEHQQQVQHHKQQQRIRQHKRDMIRQHTQLPRPSRLVQPRARGSYATGASEEYIPIAKDPRYDSPKLLNMSPEVVLCMFHLFLSYLVAVALSHATWQQPHGAPHQGARAARPLSSRAG